MAHIVNHYIVLKRKELPTHATFYTGKNEGQHVKCNKPATKIQILKAVHSYRWEEQKVPEAAWGHWVGWGWVGMVEVEMEKKKNRIPVFLED